MRLWSIHPKYLDTIGLLASWREGLLAKKVVSGDTKGYKNHPQLIRFKNSSNPFIAINIYLFYIYKEAKKRGYNFDLRKLKIDEKTKIPLIEVTVGQIKYEFELLKYKLLNRNLEKYEEIKNIKIIEPHPIFQIVDGEIENWEKVINKIIEKNSFTFLH